MRICSCSFSEHMEEVFGPARDPGEPLTSVHEDVAASLQARLEEVYLHLVTRLAARTGSPNARANSMSRWSWAGTAMIAPVP